MKRIGNYAWDLDAKKWVRAITLEQYTWWQWSGILQHLNKELKAHDHAMWGAYRAEMSLGE